MKLNFSRLAVTFLFLIGISLDSVIRFVIEIFERLPIIGELSSLVLPITVIILLFLSLPYIKQKINGKTVFAISCILAYLVVSYLINSSLHFVIEENVLNIITYYIPFMIIGSILVIDDKILKIAYYYSLFAVILNWGYTYYFIASGRFISIDSMFESYAVLPHALIICMYFFRNKTIVSFAALLVSTWFLFSMGTRGPVAVMISYVLLGFVFDDRISRKFKLILTISLGTIVGLLLFTDVFTGFVIIIRNLVSSMNLSTRVFDAFLYGAAQDSIDERNIIYNLLFDLLNQRPILGYGPFGEYLFIGWSAHSIYIQILFEFGYLIGCFIIFVFSLLVIRYFVLHHSILDRMFSLIWIVYIYIQGFFGGNIYSYYFFFAIGLFVCSSSSNRRTK